MKVVKADIGVTVALETTIRFVDSDTFGRTITLEVEGENLRLRRGDSTVITLQLDRHMDTK